MLVENKTFKAQLVLNKVKGLTIRNCVFTGVKTAMILLRECEDVLITECTFENCGGIYALLCRQIEVSHCVARDINAIMPRGQFFQSDKSKPPMAIHHNEIACLANTVCEDVINLYKTFGSPAEQSRVYNNRIHCPAAISVSGGGIMLGDNGGSYQSAHQNLLHTPGQYGIGVAGGEYITVTENEVYSPKTKISNVGIYVWKQKAEVCRHIVVADNKVSWVSSRGTRNPWWLGPHSDAVLRDNQFNWIPSPQWFKTTTEKEQEVLNPPKNRVQVFKATVEYTPDGSVKSIVFN